MRKKIKLLNTKDNGKRLRETRKTIKKTQKEVVGLVQKLNLAKQTDLQKMEKKVVDILTPLDSFNVTGVGGKMRFGSEEWIVRVGMSNCYETYYMTRFQYNVLFAALQKPRWNQVGHGQVIDGSVQS